MSRMKDLELEIKKLMSEMSGVLEIDQHIDILNFLPRSDDPSLVVRLPPGAPYRNTSKTQKSNNVK